MRNLWDREPAAYVGFATALITLLVAFGLPIDNDQKVAIITFVQVAAGFLVRSQVTPV